MKRRFYVTVTYQETTTKLASAKFDGQTARWRWNRKLDTLWEISFVILVFRLIAVLSSVKPPSPFTLRLYAKRFLHSDMLVGKTQEILPPAGPTSGSCIRFLVHSPRLNISHTDLSIDLTKEQAGQSTQPVKLHLKVTVSVVTRPSNSSPTNPFPRSAHPYPITPDARPVPSPTPSPTNHMPANVTPDPRPPAGPTNPTTPFAGPGASFPVPSPIAPHARPEPILTPAPSNHVPIHATPDPRFLSGSTNSRTNVASTSSSSVNHTNSVAASASYSPIVPPKPTRPIVVNPASSSSLSPNPADRSASTPRSSPRLAASIVNDNASRTHLSGPSTPEFEPTIRNIIPTVERRAPKPATPTTASPNHTPSAGPSTSRAQPSAASTSIIPAFEPESDIDEIIQTVERSVHQSEV
jgi:hypothetical protein